MISHRLFEELLELLRDGRRRGVREPSPELAALLVSLAKPSVNVSVGSGERSSSAARARVARPRKKRAKIDMSHTISDLAAKLRAAFDEATEFEQVLTDPLTQSLTKPNVALLYKETFKSERSLPNGLTKPELFNVFRRERINRVRATR